MSNAINYYLNQIASTASESFRTYFDFNSGNNLSILSNKSGNAFLKRGYQTIGWQFLDK